LERVHNITISCFCKNCAEKDKFFVFNVLEEKTTFGLNFDIKSVLNFDTKHFSQYEVEGDKFMQNSSPSATYQKIKNLFYF